MSCQGWFLWPLTYPCSPSWGLAEAPGPNGTQLSGTSTKNLSEEPWPGKSSDSCQVHQRKTTQDRWDSLTDWPANTNLLTPNAEHVEQCSKAISYKSQICRTEAKLQTGKTSVEPSPPRQQFIFFLQRRPGTPGACCRTCCSTEAAVGASTASNAACSPGRDVGSLAPEPQGDSGISHVPCAQPGAEVSIPVALTHFTPASLCCSAPDEHNRRERQREREITKTKPRALAKGMSVPIAKLRSFTSIKASVCIPRPVLSLLRQGRLSQRSQEVPVQYCYSVFGPEFPFGNLTGLLFTALTLKFGKWVLLKRFKIYFKIAIKAMFGMNVNMQWIYLFPIKSVVPAKVFFRPICIWYGDNSTFTVQNCSFLRVTHIYQEPAKQQYKKPVFNAFLKLHFSFCFREKKLQHRYLFIYFLPPKL